MIRKSTFFLFVVLATLFVVGTAHAASKLQVKNLVTGTGVEAVRHSKVTVHYTGWLMNGTKFDSSVDRGKPFDFTLGGGQVIRGWDQGVEGMKVGGKRELIIPPKLAYGQRGAGGVIPPNATLKFQVELLAVALPKYNNVDNATLKSLLKKGVKIVDIRRPDEWKSTGVIEGSKLITAFDGNGNFNRAFPGEFESYVGKKEGVILICRTGNRTSVLSQMLTEQAGFSKVYNVTDGIVKWIDGKNPVVKAP
ncbi:MAG: peptidylprolyl isomerase [Rhodospirillaceae bacterium]|jgi:rhodanese-related sulfurtransferase|nr:peptidylprolyl isomerase [Rhodospirillales bacterium]MBT3907527.1 peptidylprolyl isomerase [Rhodospirillaceae bacterium]MBT4700972.1 peptidylprolyl isomerase [Rhodospirillaceae bacterium]MBT5036823.1 peptidylprolyl isomerase [Rhodospirillaceae bacterium]MBT6219127.1 peptidylprolyl isomerase [Rhodospirillaceae bacterium]